MYAICNGCTYECGDVSSYHDGIYEMTNVEVVM
jgi:hypothetical protein